MNEDIERDVKLKSQALQVSVTALRGKTVDWTNPICEFHYGVVAIVKEKKISNDFEIKSSFIKNLI